MSAKSSGRKSLSGPTVPSTEGVSASEQTSVEHRADTRRCNLAAQEQADRELVAQTEGRQRPSKLKARQVAPWLADGSRKRALSSAAEPAAPKKVKSVQSQPKTNPPKATKPAKTSNSKVPTGASNAKLRTVAQGAKGGSNKDVRPMVYDDDHTLENALDSDGESEHDGSRPVNVDDEAPTDEEPESEGLGSDVDVIRKQLDFERPVWTKTPQVSRRSRRQVLSDGEDDDDNAIMSGPLAGSRRLSQGSVSSDIVSLPPDTDYASSGDFDMERGYNELEDDEDMEAGKGKARNKAKSRQPSTQNRRPPPPQAPNNTRTDLVSSRSTKADKAGSIATKSRESMSRGTSSSKPSAVRASNPQRQSSSTAAKGTQRSQSQSGRSNQVQQHRANDAWRSNNPQARTMSSSSGKQKTKRQVAHEAEAPTWKPQAAPAQRSTQRTKPKPSNSFGAKTSNKPITVLQSDMASEDDEDASKGTNESYGRTATIVFPTYGGLKLMAQHPKLQDVIRGAVFKVIVDFLFDNAFPFVTSRAAFVRVILIAVAREKKALEIKNRAREDMSFSRTFAPMIMQRLNNERGDLSKAGTIASDKYDVRSRTTKAERALYVEQLLDPYDTWMFPKSPQGQILWHLPLNNESIITVIETSWFADTNSFGHKHIYLFESGLSADLYPKESKEPELPKSMIAIAGTAVYAGIVAWETGERVVALRFTAKRFEDKFFDLMKILTELQERNVLEYHQLVHNMFLKVAGKQKASARPSLALARIQLQAVDDADAGGEGSAVGGDEDEDDGLSGQGRFSDGVEGEVSGDEEDFEDRGFESHGGYEDGRGEDGGYEDERYNDAIDEDGGYEDGHDEVDGFEDGGYDDEGHEDDGHNGGGESDDDRFMGVFGAGGLEHGVEGSGDESGLHGGERAGEAENGSDGED